MDIKVGKSKKDWFGVDPFRVPKYIRERYPDKHFAFIKCDPDRVNKKEGLGYDIVRVNKPKIGRPRIDAPTTEEKNPSLESSFRVGDTILMMIGDDEYRDRQAQIEAYNRSLTRHGLKNKLTTQVKTVDERLEVTGEIKEERGGK
jgi:hypothetical protein